MATPRINKDLYVGDTGKQLKQIKTNADNIATNTTNITNNTNKIATLSYNLTTGATPIKTGRKIDNKDEYVYRINIGTLPNNGNKTYSLPFTIGKCYDIKGVARRSTDNVDFPLPYVNPGAGMAYCIGVWTQNKNTLIVNTGTNRTDLSGYVDIYFSY